MSFLNLNPTTVKINFDLPKFDRNFQIIHNLTKNKTEYTFNQKLCFHFQPGMYIANNKFSQIVTIDSTDDFGIHYTFVFSQ
jgi:hypothetical protein